MWTCPRINILLPWDNFAWARSNRLCVLSGHSEPRDRQEVPEKWFKIYIMTTSGRPAYGNLAGHLPLGVNAKWLQTNNHATALALSEPAISCQNPQM